MDFRDLRYFEVIATEGNLGRAAERLFRTQPALTKCIDRLEADLGAQLFEKSGRHMRLTAAGTALLARARRLAIMVEDTSRELQEHASGLRGTIRIGCVPTLAQHLMPSVFQDLLAEAPEVKVELMVAMNDPILRALREGQLDLVVGPVVDADEELESEQFAEDVVVVMAASNHRIFQGEYALRDLLDYKWILPAPGVATRQFLDQTFERNGLARPQIQIESNVLNMILPILEKTHLLGFVTRFNLRSASADLREVELPETTMRRRLGLTYRRTGYISPVMQRISAFLRTRGATLLD
ncbi:LysR family transcriptional regulator [Massilia litorea]|jgi:DNA-binding transcriptional LysR family regulator|uniref:LysR family transcriptional regulator n=1 Tax=Massilia litorea TaxID=2769491 RepID=A0A7L9U6L0_9BURK|nr:LysR family transcriptional regulator [Massilia litorea]QOL50059.1 LysR family transcriptional regulator [Massilia litorea]